jgi:polyisoprenoid-binding protein YceI
MNKSVGLRDPPPVMQPGGLATGIYAIDPVHTFVLFSARHLVIGRVLGRFDRLTATLTVTARPEDWTVNATIDPPQQLSDAPISG